MANLAPFICLLCLFFGSTVVKSYPVIQISSEAEAVSYLNDAGDNLVVLWFSLPWCALCDEIAPTVDLLASQFSNVLFLKVSPKIARELTTAYEVSSVPDFRFIRNNMVVGQLEGFDPDGLNMLLQQYS